MRALHILEACETGLELCRSEEQLEEKTRAFAKQIRFYSIENFFSETLLPFLTP